VLTNTVYLDAGWLQKFKQESTAAAPFTKLDGSTVSSQMMNSAFESVSVAVGSNYTAVVLPYEDTQLRFVAVLPNPGALADVEAGMSSEWLHELNGKLNDVGAVISLPRLDYGQATELRPQLEALGMVAAFNGGADFSGLTPTTGVYIEHVVHEAVLKVLEGGTIAAGATAVVFGRKSAIAVQQTIRFDRPFLFAITDEPTGALLFLGRVLDPTAK
jgi:serpin B